jgi:glycine/D-amino acid oxidase-like deaminating enzyme
VLAAGPWTRELAPARVAPLWGVNVEVRLPGPPRHVLEQTGIDDAISGVARVSPPGRTPATEPGLLGRRSAFSIVTAGGVSAVGSTFLPDEPDPAELAPLLLERGARYLPALGEPTSFSARACPRPQSFDSRPLLGPHPGVEGLYVATGHGPWGVSLGPGSAELVAGAILGGGTEIPPELAASRAA